MDRQQPRTTSDEIDLYIRTYYSLLRSSGEVLVRAFEEAHSFSNSSLHSGAREATPDVAAFAYSAGRLPECMPRVQRIIMGQSVEQFEQAGFGVGSWQPVRARGRRRAMRFNDTDTLAVFVTSTSDIDDFVPIVTAYQIEWNKMHACGDGLGLDEPGSARLRAALGSHWKQGIAAIDARECKLSVRLLNGAFSEYQRSADRWWSAIDRAYLPDESMQRRPVYFVSSNTHSLVNLVGGYARGHRNAIVYFARDKNPEGLAERLDETIAAGDEAGVSNLLYYLLRAYLHEDGADPDARQRSVQSFDAESGICTVSSPGRIDVSAQIIELGRLQPERLDPRVCVDGVEQLAASDAVIVNIDYPLGMAAYHHLSRIARGIGELRGIYIMGKAATLNSRVGDVMIPKAVHDEHSRNTYLLRNCFSSADVQPLLQYGTVLDNQKAVTVRSAFLQNHDFMSVFYAEGYTIMEMEAGPYLSAAYEIVHPKRHPNNEIVNLSHSVPFDIGFLHYASDTPYSRRQSLLSKSMSFFGVDSSYGCAAAILQRIFRTECERL